MSGQGKVYSSYYSTTKPTIAHLCNWHHIQAPALSQAARVNLIMIEALLVGYDCNRELAVRVLDAVNRLSGKHYTIDDISFTKAPPIPEHHAQGRAE